MDDDSTLQDYVLRGIFDIGVETAGQVVSAALHSRTENSLTEANVRIIELESEVRRRQEAERVLLEEKAEWEDSRQTYLEELDTRKERNDSLWEHLDGIHATIDVDARECVPRLAALYGWMQSNPGTGELPDPGVRQGGSPAGTVDD